jgi:D-3-phosphoglycerate dehydrogenase
MMRILIAETKDFSNEAVRALEVFAKVDLIDLKQEAIVDALKLYDVFWFRLGFKLSADIIMQAEQCKFIICPVTGLDHIDLEACKQKQITVISLKGEKELLKKVRATAEHTIGLALSLLRNIPQAVNSTQNNTWNRTPFKGHELYEKTVGILGVGRLGTITSGYFKAFGANVLGFDVHPFDAQICEPVADMNELFRKCDLISVHVNLNDDTYHLIGDEQFNLMKPGSWFINTSRGQIVDSAALINALKNNRLAGAATDVIEQEFNYQDDILLQYAKLNDNLIITPHIGGNTYESFAKTELFMVEKLKLKLTH